jgi:predicted flap endonuclease-1-like 5' DNA nuclease
MDEQGFRQFMKKQHRSLGTMDSCVDFTQEFEEYLNSHFNRMGLNEAQPEHLDAFLAWGKGKFSSMNSYLWAISRYYEYAGNDSMRRYANQIRNQKIEKGRSKRPSLLLKEIEGIKPEYFGALGTLGINNAAQLIHAGKTHNSRLALSGETGIPYDAIVELVKLADLCRISDIKGMRVRLLFDTGFDTIEKIADQDPVEMREEIIKIDQRNRITARHPTLTETKFWVEQAKKLSKLVEY